jgi:hypothetical protein
MVGQGQHLFFQFKMLSIMFFLNILLCLNPAMAQIGVPERPNPNLPDIAMVQLTPNGPVIFYNPTLCNKLGAFVCNFYRWHEYGHVNLSHGYVPNYPQIQEHEADCWAAGNAPCPIVRAAWQFFINGGGGTPVHGPGPVRAQRLQQCCGPRCF